MNIYFVYIYTHPTTKLPFYVGYGKNKRHLDHLVEAKRNPSPKQGEHKLNTIRKLLRESKEPIIEIVDRNLSKEQACSLEIKLISTFGRRDIGTGTLTNLTAGGDGFNGLSEAAKSRIVSDEANKKRSDKLKGRSLLDITKNKIAESLTGHTVTEETRRKLSIKNLGKKNPNYPKSRKSLYTVLYIRPLSTIVETDMSIFESFNISKDRIVGLAIRNAIYVATPQILGRNPNYSNIDGWEFYVIQN